ncbi:MAG: hypothetical protein ACE365_01810 [Gammaproteobacteria bacterium]
MLLPRKNKISIDTVLQYLLLDEGYSKLDIANAVGVTVGTINELLESQQMFEDERLNQQILRNLKKLLDDKKDNDSQHKIN